jgi:thiol-disulfide isomerase/thioredoxin
VKGTPVAKFEPGKVYVVEFWATWCGPCKASIPHLSELAKKYQGKVTFTGVSVWENPRGQVAVYLPKVKSFVKEMGEKMSYNVAYDGASGTMAESWMAAADQNGIPAAFVIDQKGKVAWIGHPMEPELGSVLSEVIAGSFNAGAAASKKAEAAKKMAELNSKMQGVVQLQRAGKIPEAIAKLDTIIPDYPQMRPQLLSFKFSMVSKSDYPAATKLGRELGENEFKNEPMMLNQIAWTFIDPEGGFKNPDYDLAISLATRAVELTKEKDAAIMDTLALAHFKAGHRDKAIALQEKAVELAKRPDSQYPDQMKKEIEDRLAMYKKSH